MGSICTVWDIPGNEKAIICYADSPQLAPTPSDFWVPKLLEATQGQWIYRNIQIHDSVAGTQSTLQKEVIQREIEEQMEQGMVGLLEEEDHWMMGVYLGDMESTTGEHEEYWLVVIKPHGRLLRSHGNVPIRLRRNLLQAGINFSRSSKSLCKQGWMAFSSQSYRGQIVLEGEKPSLAVPTAALFG